MCYFQNFGLSSISDSPHINDFHTRRIHSTPFFPLANLIAPPIKSATQSSRLPSTYFPTHISINIFIQHYSSISYHQPVPFFVTQQTHSIAFIPDNTTASLHQQPDLTAPDWLQQLPVSSKLAHLIVYYVKLLQ